MVQGVIVGSVYRVCDCEYGVQNILSTITGVIWGVSCDGITLKCVWLCACVRACVCVYACVCPGAAACADKQNKLGMIPLDMVSAIPTAMSIIVSRSHVVCVAALTMNFKTSYSHSITSLTHSLTPRT